MTDKVTTTAAYSASGSTFAIGALTANELATYIGIVCAVLTTVVNIWFKFQHLKLARDKRSTDSASGDE